METCRDFGALSMKHIKQSSVTIGYVIVGILAMPYLLAEKAYKARSG